MKRLIAMVALACLVVAVAFAGKPATVRLTSEDLTAQFMLEKAGKLVVTSKGTPLPAGESILFDDEELLAAERWPLAK